MLYTLSKADYDLTELQQILAQVRPDDAVVLWQNGVLQAVKNPQIFAQLPQLFALENDVKARGLRVDIETISLAKLVQLTEQFYPQIAL